MKVIKKEQDDGSIRLDVTATASEVDNALDESQVAFFYTMGLTPPPGMPLSEVASEIMGIKDIDSIVAPQVVEYLIPFAVSKHDLTPGCTPQILSQEEVKRGKPLQFVLRVIPKPSFELSSYDPISITVKPMSSSDKFVDIEIAKMSANNPSYFHVDTIELESGGSCKMAIRCTKESGEEVKGLTNKSRTYTLGKGYMPQAFEDAVVGMKVGETKSFSFTAPGTDDDGKTIDVPLDCTVTILEILEEVFPEINDEWVARNMPIYLDVDHMRKNLAARYDAQIKYEYDHYMEQVAVGELMKRFDGNFEPDLYEGTMRELAKNLRNNLPPDMSMQDFIDQSGGEQQFNMGLMMQAYQVLSQGYSLDALYRNKKLSYTEEDLLKVCAETNAENPWYVRDTMEQMGMGYLLRESAERACATRWLLEHADITVEEEGAEEETPTE